MKDFLIRCEHTSVATALLIGVVSAAVWADALWGGAVLAGAAWMLLNLRVLRWLCASVLSPQIVPIQPLWSRRAYSAPLLLKGPGLYGLGYLLLRLLPTAGLVVGLSLPLVVVSLTAAAQAFTVLEVKG